MEGPSKRAKAGYTKGGPSTRRRPTARRGRRVPARARAFAPMFARATASRARALATLNTRTAGFLGLEKKFYDTGLTLTGFVAPTDCVGGMLDPSATSMISTPAVGTSEQNREGKRIVIKSIQITGQVSTVASELAGNPPGPTLVFVALVQDTQTNANQMNSQDCFKNIAGSTNVAANPVRNLLYASRFKVLKAQVFDLSAQTLSHTAADSFSVASTAAPFNWYLPCEIPVNFNSGTTAAVANVIDNSLHIVGFATTTVFSPSIAYNARIRFMG